MLSKTSPNQKRLSLILTLVLGALTLYLLSYAYHSGSPLTRQTSSGEVGYDYDTSIPPRAADGSGTKDTPERGNDDQLVIKGASVDMTVRDLDESTDKVRGYAKEIGGTVENLRDVGKDKDRVVVISIRIPSASFDATVKRIKDLGVDVLSTSEDSSDVTRIYVDLEARLKSQKALEEQLIAILAKATTVEDTLAVQEHLSRVRTEIEALQAQIDYYDSQVSMSTITVSMSTSSETVGVWGDAWRPLGVFRDALSALVSVAKGVGTTVIWIGVFSPLLLLGYWVVNKLVRRK